MMRDRGKRGSHGRNGRQPGYDREFSDADIELDFEDVYAAEDAPLDFESHNSRRERWDRRKGKPRKERDDPEDDWDDEWDSDLWDDDY